MGKLNNTAIMKIKLRMKRMDERKDVFIKVSERLSVLFNRNIFIRWDAGQMKVFFGKTDSEQEYSVAAEASGLVPEEVADKMKALLTEYNAKEEKGFADILDLHVKFERIHPFQDGNGRVGRLIMFKECLKYNIVPFIIEDNLKMFYYRGLKEWDNEKGYLTDTCLTAQDKYKAYLDYFRIGY